MEVFTGKSSDELNAQVKGMKIDGRVRLSVGELKKCIKEIKEIEDN